MDTNTKAFGIGIIVWALVVVFMRVLGTTFFSEGSVWLILLYIISFPAGIAFAYITRAILNVPMREMLTPMVIFAIVAVMLDGLSIGFTNIYGTGDQELYSAAFLLWAPGVFLLCTLWLINRAERSA